MPAKKHAPGSPGEPVIMRIRMRRSLLTRIKTIVAHDRTTIQESWNLSDGVREILLDWVQRREHEIALIERAQFSGPPPAAPPRAPTKVHG